MNNKNAEFNMNMNIRLFSLLCHKTKSLDFEAGRNFTLTKNKILAFQIAIL